MPHHYDARISNDQEGRVELDVPHQKVGRMIYFMDPVVARALGEKLIAAANVVEPALNSPEGIAKLRATALAETTAAVNRAVFGSDDELGHYHHTAVVRFMQGDWSGALPEHVEPIKKALTDWRLKPEEIS